MNYASYPTFEAFLEVVYKDVREEWLIRGSTYGFRESLEGVLRCIYEMSKGMRVNFVPDPCHILEPMKWLSPADVRVIILAQDPYPRLIDGYGIAFHSLNRYCPRSAQSINANLAKYGHIPESKRNSSDYRPWLRQGVFLGNITLTTEEGKSDQHAVIWQGVMIKALQMIPNKPVALLLGRQAKAIVSNMPHVIIIEHVHPVSRGDRWMEFDAFGQVNILLEKSGRAKIDWTPG